MLKIMWDVPKKELKTSLKVRDIAVLIPGLNDRRVKIEEKIEYFLESIF